jgi:hypothetical protein
MPPWREPPLSTGPDNKTPVQFVVMATAIDVLVRARSVVDLIETIVGIDLIETIVGQASLWTAGGRIGSPLSLMRWALWTARLSAL